MPISDIENTLIDDWITSNEQYAGGFKHQGLVCPPHKHAALLTCMDARLLPSKFLGIKEGDVHVIRNAGGRAADAIRSLIISQQLLGTREIVVIHHTDCGMLTFTDDILRNKLKEDIGSNADHIAFLPFSDVEKSVIDDVEFLKHSPYLLDCPILGFIYDVKTGLIHRIV